MLLVAPSASGRFWIGDDAEAILPVILVSLLTPTVAVLDAAIDGDRGGLEHALGCEIADGWDVFSGALPRMRDALAADSGASRWGTRLFILDDPRTLIGWGGFKGAPRHGVVEIGYAIAPHWERRGLATASVCELLREAFTAEEVQTVLAHTLAKRGPSVRVLEKTGFVHDGEVGDREVGTTWRFRRDRIARSARTPLADPRPARTDQRRTR